MISPNYDVTKLTKPVSIETYIDIYEDRIRFWMIEPAKILSRYQHGGYAICSLLVSYFESFAIYLTGENSQNKSKKFISEGLFSVFPYLLEKKYTPEQIEEIKTIMYVNFRCGLYHTGLPKDKIILVQSKYPFTYATNSNENVVELQVDTSKLILAIEHHFNNYVCKLRDKNEIEIRENFLSAMKLLG